MKLDCITVTKILRCFRSNRCRKWRNRFKNKKFVALAEYFEQQQTAADVQEKLANQGEALHGGISHIYVSLWNKWKSCQGAIDSRLCNLRTTLKKHFQFQWNCKQLWIEARNSMAYSDNFTIFSEAIHTIMKIF